MTPHFHERKSTHILTLCRRASETPHVILVPWDIMGSKKVRNVHVICNVIEFSCFATPSYTAWPKPMLIKLKMS